MARTPSELLADLAAGRGRIEPITVEQYHRMLETGILAEGAPIELLDGMLVHKDRGSLRDPNVTVGPRHSYVIRRLLQLAPAVEQQGCLLFLQCPITIPDNHEPEPDAAIVVDEPGQYRDRHPGAQDVSCVIEVSDSSLAFDRGTKQRIYARAGIPQYVIVNLVDDIVEVYEDPDGDAGTYRSRTEVRSPDPVALRVGPDARLSVPAIDWLG